MSYGYENGACAQMAKSPAVPRPVPDAFGRLRNSVTALDAAVATLADRLESVLGPEQPEKENGGEIRGRACEVAESALSEAARVDYIVARLDRLLGRLQV